MTRRLFITVAILVASAMGVAGGAFAFIESHATASATFHVAGRGDDLALSVSRITGSLGPGDSLPVSFTVTNTGRWSLRVKQVRLDTPGFTGLPDGCPASAFEFRTVVLNARLDGGDSLDGKGKLSMDRGADVACAGADPVVHLEVAA